MEKQEIAQNDLPNLTNIEVLNIKENNGYIHITLCNGEKILTNGTEIYNVSNYPNFTEILEINNEKYAVFESFSNSKIINLSNNECVFEDKDVCFVAKVDEYVIRVYKNSNEQYLYNLETKQYINIDENYEYEQKLKDGYYSIVEKDKNYEKEFHDRLRMIIDKKGKVIAKDIKGYIYYDSDNIIIYDKKDFAVLTFTKEKYEFKKFEQNEQIIGKPQYSDGKIVLVEAGQIKVINTNLEVLDIIKVPELKSTIDTEICGKYLYISISDDKSSTQFRKVFINLENQKIIRFENIEQYECWNPTSFVGINYINDKKECHFYNKDFEFIYSVLAKEYAPLGGEKEDVFLVYCDDKRLLIDPNKKIIKEVKYNRIDFAPQKSYGHALNLEDEVIDFLDENYNAVVKNFKYNEHNIKVYENLSVILANNHAVVSSHIPDGTISRFRRLIINKEGKVLLDTFSSVTHIGKFFQISSDTRTTYFNTETGEQGELFIKIPYDFKQDKIDFNTLIQSRQIQLFTSNSNKLLENGEQVKKKTLLFPF